jgi:hypothetical protein
MSDLSELPNPSAPAHKQCKYARPEWERRFLLAGIPPGEVVQTADVTDHYLLGTRLRLRRTIEVGPHGTRTVYKFTQKVPALDGGPGLITTVYLNAAEYDRLAALSATVLRKTRLSIPPLGVDVFAARPAFHRRQLRDDVRRRTRRALAPLRHPIAGLNGRKC